MTKISEASALRRNGHRIIIGLSCIAICVGAVLYAPAHAKDRPAAAEWTYQPQAPGGAAPNMTLPARDAAGGWITPNSGISEGEALFNLRAGLNVAALGCRGMAYEQQLIDNYNALQLQHKAAIAQAERNAIAGIGRRTGVGGNAGRDRMGTKLYNYFAMPPVQKNFCPVAYRVSQDVRRMSSAELASKAPGLLREIEAPFQQFYTQYAQYQLDLQRWTANGGKIGSGSVQTAAYQQKMAEYKVAMAKYEADKKAYSLAYAKWEADAKACRAGDRSRCAQPSSAPSATLASAKPTRVKIASK
jgi:hypothetical protein